MRRWIRIGIERLTGLKVQHFGRTLAFVSRARPSDAWFSYPLQLENIIRACKVDLVLDVGANEGQFGQRIREIYSGELLSFEPVSTAFAKLSARASRSPSWRAYNVALGSEVGSATINVSEATVFSSLLKANGYSRQRFGEAAVQQQTETVQVRRLDEFLAEHVPDIGTRRVLLKMDTQGFDDKVFAGLGACVSRVVALQSEVSLVPIYEQMPQWADTLKIYESAGLAIAGMFPVNWDSGRVIEYDCLMVRARN